MKVVLMMKIREKIWVLSMILLLFFSASCGKKTTSETVDIKNIPEYSGEAYVSLNDNQPFFDEDDFTEEEFESYSEKDYLNRCGVAFANIGYELMPTEERGAIGQVKPSGWQIAKYDFTGLS